MEDFIISGVISPGRIAFRVQMSARRGRSFKHSDWLCQHVGYVSSIRRVCDQKERGFDQRQLEYLRLMVCYVVSLVQRLLLAVQRSVVPYF
jgi:hypothetical protein